MVLEERKKQEVDFHNRREKDRTELDEQTFQKKYSNKKFYSVVRKSKEFINGWIRGNCQGKVVLDYCCGLGGTSIELAKWAAFVCGIDISDVSIQTAAKTASELGYGGKTEFIVMDAENLEFDDSFFDVIICTGVLHHINLEKAYPELRRVLKPDGKILCNEALGYNPLINLYRKMTPHLRTAWETEHILTLREVRLAEAYFDKLSVHFFHLFSILAVPLRKTPVFNPVLTLLENIDSLILRLPVVQLLAWQMVFILAEPKAK